MGGWVGQPIITKSYLVACLACWLRGKAASKRSSRSHRFRILSILSLFYYTRVACKDWLWLVGLGFPLAATQGHDEGDTLLD